MPLLPQSFIDEVKNTVDIVELVSKYTQLKYIGGGIWRGTCPHPDHRDSDPSFTVWQDTKSWACLACHAGKKDIKDKNDVNYGSDCFAFLEWIEGISLREAVLKLAKEYNIPVPTDKNTEFYESNKLLNKAYHKSLSDVHLSYLHSRGLDKNDIDSWMLGTDGDRIVFPLFDRYKNILGFCRRWLNMPKERSDKYRNSKKSEIFDKSRYLYGIQYLDKDCDEIRITEGPMDVILAHKYGLKNVVASLGTAFTESHAEIIKNLGKTPVLCMDGDPPGIASINKAAKYFANIDVYCKILIIPSKKDLADLSLDLKEDLEDYVLSNSKTYGQYILENVVSKYDSAIQELRLKLMPEVKESILKIPHEDERDMMISYIRERMAIDIKL